MAAVLKDTVASNWWHRSSKVICIGRNYLAHVHELNNKVPSSPFWFMKPPSSIISSGTPHVCPPGRSETHHELELGVIIGERARHVSVDKAMQFVGGYCLALDMTDREGQQQAKSAGKPWTMAKAWDTSCPVSQFVAVADVPDYQVLNMWLKVNGEGSPRQFGSPSQMIFDIPTLISEVSKFHTLEPFDLILTGTPEGVGPVYPGDTITAGITELDIELRVPIVSGESVI